MRSFCHWSIKEEEFEHISYSHWSPVSSALSQKWYSQPHAIKMNQQEVGLWLMTLQSHTHDLHLRWVQKVTK